MCNVNSETQAQWGILPASAAKEEQSGKPQRASRSTQASFPGHPGPRGEPGTAAAHLPEGPRTRRLVSTASPQLFLHTPTRLHPTTGTGGARGFLRPPAGRRRGRALPSLPSAPPFCLSINRRSRCWPRVCRSPKSGRPLRRRQAGSFHPQGPTMPGRSAGPRAAPGNPKGTAAQTTTTAPP